jgi:trehalose 6-phosphate synthase
MPSQARKTRAAQRQVEQILTPHLIIVSNRGPVEYTVSQDKTLKHRRGSGGVVTALVGAVKQMEATWVALAMTEGDRLALQQAHDGLLPSPLPDTPLQLRYITVPKVVYRKYYDIISNQVLWFLQHYLLDQQDGSLSPEQMQDAWERGYCKANQALADAVCAELDRDAEPAVVLLQDYHLYLTSAMIRKRHYNRSMILQQFIHIPWPEVRYWQTSLPTNITQAIYTGLLGNDILGFQTRRDAQNFLEGVPAVLPEAEIDRDKRTILHQDHRTLVRDYPISISVSEEQRIVQSAAGRRAVQQIQPLLGEQTIMRVDRIEPTKNIVQGFQAYKQLLEQHPELQKKVRFLAFLVPSRQSLPLYRRYNNDVLAAINETNQQFACDGWTPISAFVENDRTQALAALQFYDVLLVNPLIDGMNLVAKEGPIVNKRDGVLVLSRTSGAFQQLELACIPISPDARETAEALFQALTLSPEERHSKADLARQEVEHNDLQTWITQQVHDINALIEASY